MLSAQNINCTLLFTTSLTVCCDKRWSGGKLHQYFYNSYTKFPARHKLIYHLHMTSNVNVFITLAAKRHTMHEIITINLCHLCARGEGRKKWAFEGRTQSSCFDSILLNATQIRLLLLTLWPSAGCKKVEFLTRLSLLWLQNIFLFLVEYKLRLMIFILLWMKKLINIFLQKKYRTSETIK